MARYVANFTQNGEQIVLGLVNNDNTTSFTPAQLIFGVPAATGEDGAVEPTSLELTAASGSGYSGSQTVNYNRVGLPFMTALAPDYVIVTDELRTHDLLPLLNEKFGINLATTDIVDEALPATEADVEVTHDLKAAAGSLVYAGAVTLTFTAPTLLLSSVLTVTTLDGLYAPTELPPVDPEDPESGG